MAEKVTKMVLKVDLQCSCCNKKIKKVLGKFSSQIKTQVYDEKANTVTITVVCCNPEKFRDKLYCKGGKTIKCIEIKKDEKPKDDKKSKDEKPPKDDKPPPKDCKPIVKCTPACPPVCVYPVGICCGPCYCGVGPCCCGFGRAVPYYYGYGYRYGWYCCEENPSGCTIM